MTTAPLHRTLQLELVVLASREEGGGVRGPGWRPAHLEGGGEANLPVEGEGGGHHQEEGQEHLGQEVRGHRATGFGQKKKSKIKRKERNT